MRVALDPRTKLFMIFVVSFIVLVSAVTPLEWGIKIAITAIPILLLIFEGRFLSALTFALFYGVALILLFYFISEESEGVVSMLLIGYCGIAAQFLPAMIMAWYGLHTTKIGEFMTAMGKMHIPNCITIPLAVVFRFFPTIKEEYGYIRDAMKMRGISFGRGSLIKMVEYRLIPLLFSCMTISDELSQSAVTRGLGAPVKRSSAIELKLRFRDYFIMLMFIGLFGLFMYAKYVRG